MSFFKHSDNPVIHFGILHFKNEETLFYSELPISRYSRYKRVGNYLGNLIFIHFFYILTFIRIDPNLCIDSKRIKLI